LVGHRAMQPGDYRTGRAGRRRRAAPLPCLFQRVLRRVRRRGVLIGALNVSTTSRAAASAAAAAAGGRCGECTRQ